MGHLLFPKEKTPESYHYEVEKDSSVGNHFPLENERGGTNMGKKVQTGRGLGGELTVSAKGGKPFTPVKKTLG